MAIKLKKPTNFSDLIQPEYWMVGIANIHPISQSCSVVLFGWMNAAARTAGKDSISRIEVAIPWAAFGDGKNPSIKDIYTYLKASDDWKAGTDI